MARTPRWAVTGLTDYSARIQVGIPSPDPKRMFLFGMVAEVFVDTFDGEPVASVVFPGAGTEDPALARERLAVYTLAIELAESLNEAFFLGMTLDSMTNALAATFRPTAL